MKATVYEIDSHVYIVIPVYHNNFYGTKRIYHILTDNPTYARRQIEAIMNDGSISKGEYELNYKRNPTLENHLKPFHNIKIVESDEYQKYELLAEQFGVDLSSYYEYEYIAHYDDWDITALTNLSCINIETGDYTSIMEVKSMQVINIYESIVEPDIKGMETSGWPHIKELWEESNCGNFRRNSKTLQRGLKLESNIVTTTVIDTHCCKVCTALGWMKVDINLCSENIITKTIKTMAQVTTINYDGTTKNSPVMPYKAAKFLYKQLRRNKPNSIHALHYV